MPVYHATTWYQFTMLAYRCTMPRYWLAMPWYIGMGLPCHIHVYLNTVSDYHSAVPVYHTTVPVYLTSVFNHCIACVDCMAMVRRAVVCVLCCRTVLALCCRTMLALCCRTMLALCCRTVLQIRVVELDMCLSWCRPCKTSCTPCYGTAIRWRQRCLWWVRQSVWHVFVDTSVQLFVCLWHFWGCYYIVVVVVVNFIKHQNRAIAWAV